MKKVFVISPQQEGISLWQFLKKALKEVPLSRLERLFRKKDIKLNQKHTNQKKVVLSANDVIEVFGLKNLQEKSVENFKNWPITFKLLYEDENILIVDKPAGLVMHGDKNSLDAQIHSYLYKNKKFSDSFLASHVGRLDKEVSGIVLYAKNYKSLIELQAKSKFFHKNYVFKADFRRDSHLSQIQIRHNDLQQKMEVVKEGGKIARTLFYINKEDKLIARPLSGRKHQIRLTLNWEGSPILGDVKYGGRKAKRLFLHSCEIKLYNLEGSLAYLNGLEVNSNIDW